MVDSIDAVPIRTRSRPTTVARSFGASRPFWMVYFGVVDVDKSTKTATAAGAKEMMGPQDFPGGRFSVLTDPQGAVFGLLKMSPRQQ